MQSAARLFWFQLGFTLLVVRFLIVPVLLSMLAGVTVNYFKRASKSGSRCAGWAVWELYRQTIFLSACLALATSSARSCSACPPPTCWRGRAAAGPARSRSCS
jgi:hypothetical protein